MNAPRRLAVLLACMLSSGWLAAQTTFTWTGNATTFPYGYGFAYANAGANWLGGTAPTADDNALLSFGASAGISANASLSVEFPYSFAVRGLTFTAPAPSYYIHSDDGGRLRLGEGATGPTLTLAGSGNSMVHIDSKIELAGNQTWAINDGTVYVYGRIDQSASGTALTKTGNGALFLDNSSSTFGSLNLQGGTLYVGASSSLGDSELISGPVGSGTLTLGDYTTLRTSTYSGSGDDDLTLHNPISLGNHVTLGNFAERNSITLAGAITPQSTNTTVEVGVDGALFIGQISRAENGSLVFAGGNISDASGGPTTMTFTSSSASRNDTLNAATPVSSEDPFPVVVLSGNNTYTGATIADGVGIIFYAPGSLGQTSSISANNGYVGTGYNGGMEAILARIAQPTSFYGALGFDTHPAAAEITVFNDNVDLSRFTNDSGGPSDGFWGLGSLTKAIITGTITPPTGGNYVFGGQEGTLYVQSNLTAPTGVRVRTPYGENPLSVWLRGANSFTGNIMSDHSIVVLDSATALPTGSSFSLDSGAYLGYTENFTAGGASTVTPAQFISRLAGTAYNHDSILGFDSASSEGRAISDPVNLSGLNDIFIGTTTHVHLDGTITAPSSGQLSVTGLNGGRLTLDAPLLAPAEAAPGVNSLNVGATTSDLHRYGFVELTSGNSTFAGGTTLNSGYLLLGASSTIDGSGAVTRGPLGTGALKVAGYYDYQNPTAIAATAAGVVIHNNIQFDYGSLQFGVPVTSESDNPASRVQAYTNNGLTLNGSLSGSASMITFTGNGTFTLNGNNSGLSSYWMQIGQSLAEGTPLVVANTDTALGGNSNGIYLGSGADLQFTSAAPSIGSISGGYTAGYDTNNRSFLALATGATLTINQNYDATLYANLGGTPGNFSSNETASVDAALVKTGHGTLTLSGNNTYTGTTTVKSGMLIAGNANAFGSGTVILDGGGIGAAKDVVFTNSISFGSAGGKLGGNGTIASAITAGSNITLAPGNSPGQLTFSSNLTLASGGVASFDISNFAGAAGSGWDQIVVSSTGSFAITATIANPFTIQINSWSDASNSFGALTSDFSTPASLAILQTSAPISGLIGNGQNGLSNLVLNIGNFTAYQGGEFTLSLSTDSTALLLNFTPVPEPSTYALFGTGLLLVAGSMWRRRSRRH